MFLLAESLALLPMCHPTLFGLCVLTSPDQEVNIVARVLFIEEEDEAFFVEASLQSQHGDDFVQDAHLQYGHVEVANIIV